MGERERIEQAIAALEAQRTTLGHGVVDTMVAMAREKLHALARAQAALQRKQVTVLFADVSGFVAMAEAMDAEEVGDAMDALWSRLDGAITAHGGMIDKHIGDGVMALFGAPAAHEDDPQRAIRAALAMQQEVKDLREGGSAVRSSNEFPAADGCRPPGHALLASLAICVGIHTGPVLLGRVGTTREYTAMGDTVNVAERLEEAAPVGGILISHDTYRHVRGVFEVQALSPIHVKGRAEPVSAYLVHGVRPCLSPVPMRGVEGIETRMVGRDAELAMVQEALHAVIDEGRLRAITVVGEAGIGKSRLLGEFERWVERLPERVLCFKGRASEWTRNVPYLLVRDLLASHFGIRHGDGAAVAREKLEEGIVRCMGADAQIKAHAIGHLIGLDFSASPYLRGVLSDAQQMRDCAFYYMAQFFAALAAPVQWEEHGLPGVGTAGRAVVLLLEDLHWADGGSLDWIATMAQACRHSPLLIVALARPELLERRTAWGQGWPVHSWLELHALSREDSCSLVQDILRHVGQLPPALRDMIVDRAEGNPFYIEELIKMLIEDGVVVKSEGAWRVEPERLAEVRVPPTLIGVLQARLDRLPPLERETLQRAAVVGRVFWDGAVARLNGGSGARRDGTTSALAALRSKELIFREERSAFAGQEEYVFKKVSDNSALSFQLCLTRHN